MNDIKLMFPPDIDIPLRKHTIDRLDSVKRDLIEPTFFFRSDIVDFLLNYYEATERIKEG